MLQYPSFFPHKLFIKENLRITRRQKISPTTKNHTKAYQQ